MRKMKNMLDIVLVKKPAPGADIVSR